MRLARSCSVILTTNLLAFLLTLAAGGAAGAESTEDSSLESGPQGGILRSAPPFKAELIIEGELGRLYLYDDKVRAVKADRKTLSGELTSGRDNRKKLKFVRRTDHYQGDLPGVTKLHDFEIQIDLQAGGRKARGRFIFHQGH